MQQLRSARGSVAPLVALLMVCAGGLALGLGRMGAVAVARAQARTAADAAALAGAAEGQEGADDVAAANGADLVAYQVEGAEVQVTVEVGPARATARARRVG